MKLHAEVLGDGPPLLIFHGLFGSGTNWRTLAKHVFAKDYETHLIDQRNHGESPHDETFNYAALAEDIIEYIEDNIVTAALPERILPKCRVTESLLAYIAVSKVLDRQPIYHLESQ